VVMQQAPQAATASELKAQFDAEREGVPFLIFRDGDGRHTILTLEEDRGTLTLGRRDSADISLRWDSQVSRVHAELVRVGEDWTLKDDGLSRNGSFVNGEMVRGQRRLEDGDALRVGRSVLIFRDPRGVDSKVTDQPSDLRRAVQLSETQRQVLIELCRPYKQSASFATPAANDVIAQRLSLSVEAVKKHLRVLYGKFAVSDLPQNEKRARLAERAFAGGFVSEHEL
jgi:pSer/pThr/pTyr-binding forkhead associated (FHA) protein